mgnify:CR=1 FL=1
MTKLNERIANVPERIFILAQLALGLLLAAGGGYGNDGEHFNSLGLAAALVLCGGLPTLIRSRIERPTPWLRGAIIGGLVVALGIYVVMRFA